jgi:alanyl aminopeptidase
MLRRALVLVPSLLLVAGSVAGAQAPAAAPAAAENPAPPELRLPEGAKPLRVVAELTVRPDQEDFPGRVTIELDLSRATSLLWLNASRLEIRSARLTEVGGEHEARIVPGGDEFVGFDFGAPVPAGRATLVIDYRGKLDPVETDGLFRQQDGGDWYVFSQFESTYARRAFPCFDEPSYRAPWKLVLHVPEGDTAVSNTAVVSEHSDGNGLKTVEFAATKPLPSYLVALGVGPFAITDGGVWGRAKTPIRIVYPRSRAGQAGYAAEVTGPLLARLEDYFEIPYAFGKLDDLAIPHTVDFGAMENPGLITYVDRLVMIDPANDAIGPRRRYASVAAHEMGHQWFGDLVTMAWWNDIWLNEGFADWISDKIVADWKPEWFSPEDRVDLRGQALRADSLASARPVRRPIHSEDDIVTAFDGISYAKGASLLNMFEAWMGPERFRHGVQSYVRKHALGNATSDDFLAALSEEHAPEVSHAFASFLDQAGAPVVTMSVVCPEGAPARLELSQHRYVPLGSQASKDQVWAVPLRFRFGAGDRSNQARTLLDAAESSFQLPYCPEWVAGNEDGIGYYVTSYGGGLLSELAGRSATLPSGEQIALLEDSALLVASGELPPAEALDLPPRFAADSHRRVVESAIDIAASVDDHLVDDAHRANYERYLHQVFGERQRKLGLDPRAGESPDDALLRPELASLLAGPGDDAAIAREVRARVDRWLADRGSLDADLVGDYLRIAARKGDAAFFDRLVEAAAAEKDQRVRTQILEAIGGFHDPALVERAMDVAFSGRFDLRESSRIFRNLSRDRDTRGQLFDWERTHYDAVVGKLPERFAAYMAFTTAGFCDSAHREAIDEFFRPREAKLPGGEIVLGQVLDIVDSCIARHAAQQQAVSEFLSAY